MKKKSKNKPNKHFFAIASGIFIILLFAGARIFPIGSINNQPTYIKTETGESLPKKVFVQRVVDGDTFVDTQKRRYRLIGIDTPELKHHEQKEEPYAQKAKVFAIKNIEKKYVTLNYDHEIKDRYNRFLVYVYLPDGKMLNRMLLKEGLADVYRSKPFKYKKEFYTLEAKAKKQQKNMWAK